MYDYIRGSIEELNPAEAVIECCGIGWHGFTYIIT